MYLDVIQCQPTFAINSILQSSRNSSERRFAKVAKHDTEQQFTKKIRSGKKIYKEDKCRYCVVYFLPAILFNLLQPLAPLLFSSTELSCNLHIDTENVKIR